MNLYTADLMVDDRMRDRDREFEANRLAALAREARPDARPSTLDRIRHALAVILVTRRGATV